jgi:hypothetical protein
MYIEKETYLAKPFIKKSFLNQSVSTLSDNLGNADFNKIMFVIKNNKTFLMPSKLLNNNRGTIYSVFEAVSNSITQDNRVDKNEIYEFIRGYYNKVKKQDISDEQIGKLRVLDLLDIILIWVKGRNNPEYRRNKVKGN